MFWVWRWVRRPIKSTNETKVNMDIANYSTTPIYSLKLVKDKTLRYPTGKLAHANAVRDCARYYLEGKDCEHLIALMIDANNNLIGMHTVSVGGISGMHVAVRDCFKAAILGRASGLILAHNHGSGDVNPSKEDLIFTEKAKEAGILLGIPLVEHLIISSGLTSEFYSFYEHGELISS